MKRFIRSFAIAAVAAGSAIVSFADVAAALTVSKYENNGKTRVVLEDAAGTTFQVRTDTNTVRRVRVNACNQIRLSVSTRYPEAANGVKISEDLGVTFGALVPLPATVNPYACANGVVVDRSAGNAPVTSIPTTPYIDASGAFIVPSSAGQNTQVQVEYEGIPNSINATMNACGFKELTHDPDKRDLTTFEIDGTNYTLATLTEKNPPVKRKVGGVDVCYEPI